MKKSILFGLIIAQAFMFKTYAVCGSDYDFSSKYFCWENERILLNEDCTCEWWIDDRLEQTGTWEFEDEDHIRLDVKEVHRPYREDLVRMEILYRRIRNRGSNGTTISIHYDTLIYNGNEYKECD